MRIDWIEVPRGWQTPSAPAVVTYNGSEYLFIRGMNDAIYVNRRTGTVWSGWSEVPGNGQTRDAKVLPEASNPVNTGPAATTVYTDTVRLFLRGVGGYVVLVDKSPLYGTFEATVIPGITTPDPPAANGTLVYVRGPDNKIYYTRVY